MHTRLKEENERLKAEVEERRQADIRDAAEMLASKAEADLIAQLEREDQMFDAQLENSVKKGGIQSDSGAWLEKQLSDKKVLAKKAEASEKARLLREIEETERLFQERLKAKRGELAEKRRAEKAAKMAADLKRQQDILATQKLKAAENEKRRAEMFERQRLAKVQAIKGRNADMLRYDELGIPIGGEAVQRDVRVWAGSRRARRLRSSAKPETPLCGLRADAAEHEAIKREILGGNDGDDAFTPPLRPTAPSSDAASVRDGAVSAPLKPIGEQAVVGDVIGERADSAPLLTASRPNQEVPKRAATAKPAWWPPEGEPGKQGARRSELRDMKLGRILAKQKGVRNMMRDMMLKNGASAQAFQSVLPGVRSSFGGGPVLAPGLAACNNWHPFRGHQNGGNLNASFGTMAGGSALRC